MALADGLMAEMKATIGDEKALRLPVSSPLWLAGERTASRSFFFPFHPAATLPPYFRVGLGAPSPIGRLAPAMQSRVVSRLAALHTQQRGNAANAHRLAPCPFALTHFYRIPASIAHALIIFYSFFVVPFRFYG